MTTALSARARQIGDAAIAVLADRGARGLTHRAVDQAAGLPPGTTSNYARTRAALLTLTLTRIAELDAADSPPGLPGLSGSALADALARMLHRMITDQETRRRVLARFELAFEATFALINLARRLEVDPETALRRTNRKFERRFREIETRLSTQGRKMADASLNEMEKIWGEVKAEEKRAKKAG